MACHMKEREIGMRNDRTGNNDGLYNVMLAFFLVVILQHGWLAGNAEAADSLARPSDTVVLTITGSITNTNGDDQAGFDMEMLKAIKSHVVKTETPWSEGIQTFEGPLLRDLLALVGAKGEKVKAMAINNYFVEIPLSDFADYPVILALSLNGKPMRVRDKGPLWIIYPWDDFPELRNEKYYSRSIWQTKTLMVK